MEEIHVLQEIQNLKNVFKIIFVKNLRKNNNKIALGNANFKDKDN